MGLTDKALSILNVLGQYTLEAIIVHVLGALFNKLDRRKLPYVKAATFFDHLERFVRVQAILKGLKKEDAYPEKNKRITPSDSSIGNRLLEFMTTRNNFIDLVTEDGKTYDPREDWA